MKAFEYFKKITQKTPKEEPAISNKAPFKAKVGSLMKLQQLPFIHASSVGSLVESPSGQEDRLCAISSLPIQGLGTLYRYYLQTEETSEVPKFVQIFVDENGQVQEAVYYSFLTSFVPISNEEQRLFTGADNCGLGDVNYTLSQEQLSFLSEQKLKQAFAGTPEGEPLTYFRDVGGETPFFSPFQAEETRVEDNEGIQGLRQDTYFMNYARALDEDNKECLLISTNIVKDSDGQVSRSIQVCFYVGIPMEFERMEVL
jgi:hypothetical protein